MATIATTEPTSIVAGDSLKWARLDLAADYPASQGWTLTYALRGPDSIDITATPDSDVFSILVPAATTANYATGDYWWAAYVTKGAERYQIGEGRLTIKPNLATLTADYDGRSHVKKTLDAIEAVIEKSATRDQQEHSVNGRKLVLTPKSELIALRDKYNAEYKRELDAEKIAKGLKTGKTIKVRFL